MDISNAYNYLYMALLLFFSILLIGCLIRAIIGPRVADRLVAVNMMGTIVMVAIAILSFYLKENYLLDICIIYAMISFLAVVMLSKVYIGIHKEREERKKND